MPNQYPYRYNTTQATAAEDDPRYETPGGAQQKADVALEDAKEYTDNHVNGTVNLADDSVTRPKIATGAVGADELDPTLLQNYGDIAVQAKFDDLELYLNFMPIDGGEFNGNDPNGPIVDGGLY